MNTGCRASTSVRKASEIEEAFISVLLGSESPVSQVTISGVIRESAVKKENSYSCQGASEALGSFPSKTIRDG